MFEPKELPGVLLECFLKSSCLDEFVDKTALLLNNPIYVCNVSYKVISHSKSIKCDDQLWLDMTALGYYSNEMIQDIMDNYLDADTQISDNTPFFRKLTLSDHMRLVSKLYFQGRYYGLLCVLCENEVNESELEAVKLVSDIIAKTIAIDKRYLQMDSDFNHSILIDLISGNIQTRGLYLNRIMATNLGDLSSFLLISISTKRNTRIEDFRQGIQRIFNSFWIFCHSDQLLVVVGSKSQIALTPHSLQSLTALVENYNVSACIGEEFSELFFLSDHYKRNQRAMELAELLNSSSNLIEYEKFKFIDMVYIASKRTTKIDLKQFVSRKVLNIWEYDKANDTNYFSTLSTYVSCNCSIINTSAKMFVHKNTVSYRIDRIEEIFKLDLSDEEVLFSTFYSCEIMKYYQEIKKQ